MKNKFHAGLVWLFVFGWITASCSMTRESPIAVNLAEGVSLPAINALAWLSAVTGAGGENLHDENSFVSVSQDGVVRIWNIFSGQTAAFNQNEEHEGLPDYQTALSAVSPELSPDKTKKLSASGDGVIILADAASGRELARYYGLASNEWVCLVPEGFYNASFGGGAFLNIERGSAKNKNYLGFRLDRLSQALFRPDLFKAFLHPGKSLSESRGKAPFTLEEIFSETPPLVSASAENSLLSTGELKITVSAQKGGAGFLALYRMLDGEEIPSGLFDLKKTADREYKENGHTCYEITIKSEPGLIGISAFNEGNTIESEPLWIEIPEIASNDEEKNSTPHGLKAFIAAAPDQEAVLGDFLSQQENGDLFYSVEISSFPGAQYSGENFSAAFKNHGADRSDVILIYIEGRLHADRMGNLRIAAGQGEDKVIYGEEILLSILGLSQDYILLFDLPDGNLNDETETALLRFRRRLGPKAVFAGVSIMDHVMDALASGFGSRYTSAVNLLSRTSELLAAQKSAFMAFYPAKDFPLADPFINAGELKFQTMTSGMLKIDRVDANPVPLAFGSTMIRTLPPGSYIIDMIYRNGYRETRMVDLRRKDSRWVVFTYTPALFTGSVRGSRLPGAINFSELNPANYERINREAMEGMGMAPYYVAYLAGEKHYRDGNYSAAITEYSRAISLNSGYAPAYVSRGNSRRRGGDYDRAIEDYNRAITLNNSYADVYNYRGFAYAQKGDLNRAITDYTQAIRARPDYADAYFNRAYAHGKLENWDGAIADYTQVIRLEPSNSVAYNARGNAWKNKDNNDRAEADFMAAERLKRR